MMTLGFCVRGRLRFSVPHPVPYQGSKRRLATAILRHASGFSQCRLIEPFAGSAAITLAAAANRVFSSFVIADRLDPLVRLWESIIENPSIVAAEYETLWHRERAKPIEAYYEIRAEFNSDRDPSKLLYLLARCVKNAVRFNPSGAFNQSPDKRRTGTRPAAMKAELLASHRILAGCCQTACADFMELFEAARPGDFFYLDPPYQGTSEGRDGRYIEGVSRGRILEGVTMLHDKGIPFLLSYDGTSGDRTYGDRLPSFIGSRILLEVGRSSQATLNGRNDLTVESLYVSHQLAGEMQDNASLSLQDFEAQRSFTFA